MGLSVIVAGATGLCASAFLRTALESPAVTSVHSFSRREPNVTQSPKLHKTVAGDAEDWPAQFPQAADIFFSGIATTRASAGGLDKQRLIDHDLQVSLAKAAKEKGCSTFILVSSARASSSSRLGYLKMKGDTEEAISKLGFDRTIIFRPGPLIGNRDQKHDGIGSSVMLKVMPLFHRSIAQAVAGYPVSADEIAQCALEAAQTLPEGIHILESKDILERTGPHA